MPKRGGRANMNGPSGSRFVAFNDVDDRDDRDRDRDRERDNPRKDRNTRRVSFKPSPLQYSGGIKRRMAEIAIRSHLEDDEDMGDMPGSSKPDNTRRKGSPIPRKKFGNTMHLSKSQFGWYRISISANYKKAFYYSQRCLTMPRKDSLLENRTKWGKNFVHRDGKVTAATLAFY